MTRADNTAALLEATAMRHDRGVRSAHKAIRELNAAGAAITSGAVAARAGVARSFLYRHRDLRAQIERLRPAPRANGRAAVLATERASRSLRRQAPHRRAGRQPFAARSAAAGGQRTGQPSRRDPLAPLGHRCHVGGGAAAMHVRDVVQRRYPALSIGGPFRANQVHTRSRMTPAVEVARVTRKDNGVNTALRPSSVTKTKAHPKAVRRSSARPKYNTESGRRTPMA